MNKRECLTRKLIDIARNRKTISYKDAGEIIGRRANNIWDILDAISQSEYDQGRPMLPAVVIVSGRGVPGDGFFTLARKIGKPAPDPGETTSIPVQRTFWKSELAQVYDYWS